LKDGVESFQKLDLSKQQEVIKTLNIKTGAKDACVALLQDDSVFTGNQLDEISPLSPGGIFPTPEEIPLPTVLEEDRPAPKVRLLIF
jgi:hypothetical protein